MHDYAFVHEGKAYTPNRSDIAPSDAERHNTEQERAELAHWETKPARMVAYYTEQGTVTTWRGVQLGRITGSRIYRHHFGGRCISVNVDGTNGARYYGRASYDWGNCITLRRRRS